MVGEIRSEDDRGAGDGSSTVAWSPRGNAAQMALLECPVFEVFFGGARGGGKTDGMLGEWVKHADAHGNGAIGLMVRRTRTELVETIERSKQIYGPLGWHFNETDKMWRAPNGARLRFAYLERDADAAQLAARQLNCESVFRGVLSYGRERNNAPAGSVTPRRSAQPGASGISNAASFRAACEPAPLACPQAPPAWLPNP